MRTEISRNSEMTYGDSVVMIGKRVERGSQESEVPGWQEYADGACAAGGGRGYRCALRAGAGGGRGCSAGAGETQFYGDRSYRVKDPEGHIWTFRVTVQRMTPAEWDAASRARDADAGRLSAAVDKIFAALADPQRRRAVELLGELPRAAGELWRVRSTWPAPAMSRAFAAAEGVRTGRGEPSGIRCARADLCAEGGGDD